MSHDVFICHSSLDKVVADAACAALEAQGIRCWIAPRDVVPGAVWAQSISDAIKSSRVMVLIYSERVNHSNQIIRELERAVDSGLAILPFRIEDAAPSGAIEYFIGSSHWLDALSEPLEDHLGKLGRSVEAILDAWHRGQVGKEDAAARRTPPFANARERPESEQDGYAAAVRAKSVAHILEKRLHEWGAGLAERTHRADSREEAGILERVKAVHAEMLATRGGT